MVGIKKFLLFFLVLPLCGVFYPSASPYDCRQGMNSTQLKIFNSVYSKFKEKTGKEPGQDDLFRLRSVVLFHRCPICKEYITERGKELRPLYLYFSTGATGDLEPCAYHFDCLYGVKPPAQRLYKAAKKGDLVMVKTLLAEGADVTWLDEQWNTAYDIAQTREIATLVKPSYWSRLKRCYRYLGQPCSGRIHLDMALFLMGLQDSFFPIGTFFKGAGTGVWILWFINSLITNAYSLATYHTPTSWGLRKPVEPKIRTRDYSRADKQKKVDSVFSATYSVAASILSPMRLFLDGGYDGAAALLLSAPTLFCDLSPLLTGQLGWPHKLWKTKTGKAVVLTVGLAAAGLWGRSSPWICSLAWRLFVQNSGVPPSLLSGPLPMVNATTSNMVPMLSPLNGTLSMGMR